MLKRLVVDGRQMLAIAGSDAVGCLYGVYGLLEDHYGVGFYLGGDVLPETERPCEFRMSTSESGRPWPSAAFSRGPIFHSRPTVYSWEDWKFILDQMAKMRMNFLHVHNYNETGLKPQVTKVPRHNEMFHNFTYRGITSRVWMATVADRSFLGGPPWDLITVPLRRGRSFRRLRLRRDCTLHNETLSNEQVFRKGVVPFPEGYRLRPYPRRENRSRLGHQPDSRRRTRLRPTIRGWSPPGLTRSLPTIPISTT